MHLICSDAWHYCAVDCKNWVVYFTWNSAWHSNYLHFLKLDWRENDRGSSRTQRANWPRRVPLGGHRKFDCKWNQRRKFPRLNEAKQIIDSSIHLTATAADWCKETQRCRNSNRCCINHAHQKSSRYSIILGLFFLIYWRILSTVFVQCKRIFWCQSWQIVSDSGWHELVALVTLTAGLRWQGARGWCCWM